MEKSQQALGTLINAVKLATTKGAYTLEEAALIAEAVKVFTIKPVEAPVEKQVEKPVEPKKK